MIGLVTFLLFKEYEKNPDLVNENSYLATAIGTAAISAFVVCIVSGSIIRDT
jgi:hypothetical protein